MTGMTAVLGTLPLPAPFAERIPAGGTPRVPGRLPSHEELCEVHGDGPPARCARGFSMRPGTRGHQVVRLPQDLADSVQIYEGATRELGQVPR